jgi:two-component system chemotaxis sensor kinase CheA
VVHHLLLYLLLPRSIFNYEASLWTVVVHGAFVVVESVAACFVARNFFGSVIGLEQKVQRRTGQLEARSNELRLMLDTVDQGFLTVDRHGAVKGERSRILDRWLPPCAPGATVWEYMALADAKVGLMFQLGWDAIVEDVLPLELLLDQLPKKLVAGGATLEIEFHPLLEGGELEHVVLVLSDVSGRIEQERIEEENADLLAVCERIASDRAGFRDFLAEADQLTAGIDSADADTRKRMVHTLKGNSALFGLAAIARLCHRYEDALEQGEAVAEVARITLLARWEQFRAKLTVLFGTRQAGTLEVTEAEYAALHGALSGAVRAEDALRTLARIKVEPVSARLERLGQQARTLAGQLEKAPLDVVVEAGDLSLERAAWSPLWSALVHVVHNAVDHGLETAAERAVRGKKPTGVLTLHAELQGSDVVLVIADDGRGVDWDALRQRAVDLELPHATATDLTDAMFASGVSTKRETTTISGRGVGMGALRSMVRRMGGTIDVTSESGQGTRVALRIPHDQESRAASKLVA